MPRKSLPPDTLLAPTPVVLVSCRRNDEKPNIITIAWAGVVCSEPPMLSVSIRPSRYSYDIIKESKEFVVNVPTLEICSETDYCGIVSGRDVDKFESTGLTPGPSTEVRAPSIAECPISIECKLKDIVPLGGHDLFLGEVVAVTADESVLDGKRIQVSRFNAIAYMPPTHEYRSVGEMVGRFGYSKKKKAEADA